MSLQQLLDERKNSTLSQVPEEVKNTILTESEKLKNSDLLEYVPKVGDQIEDFYLMNQINEYKSLDDFLQKGPVVITFYRGGWCPYCNLELHAYQDILSEIKALGGSLIAITPEVPDASLTTAEKHNLEFEVLSDINSDYAHKLGISFTLSDSLIDLYNSFDIDIEKYNGEDQFDLPFAATFIVDSSGLIAYAFVDTDYTVRAEPSEVIQELKALVE